MSDNYVAIIPRSIHISGEPNLEPPSTPPVVSSTSISLTCGQDVTVKGFTGVETLSLQCSAFNGSDITSLQIYKDGEVISSDSLTMSISYPDDDDFGTYTFVLSTRRCGSTQAVSRVLRKGWF